MFVVDLGGMVDECSTEMHELHAVPRGGKNCLVVDGTYSFTTQGILVIRIIYVTVGFIFL